jgi:hypothetical protein
VISISIQIKYKLLKILKTVEVTMFIIVKNGTFFVLQIVFIISLHEFYTLVITINHLHTKKEKNRLLMFKRCRRGENGVPVENPSPLHHLYTLRLRRHCYSLNLLFSCNLIAFFFVFVSSLWNKLI